MKPWISIIIPVYNEGPTLHENIRKIRELFHNECEIFIVDASDHTPAQKPLNGVTFLQSTKAMRSFQMNQGAEHATTPLLLFLHADTVLPDDAYKNLLSLQTSPKPYYGAFFKKFDTTHWALRCIAYINNVQLSYRGSFLGDNAPYISTDLFRKIGGYPDIALMEDVELSKTLATIKKLGSIDFHPNKSPVITSARKFMKNGIIKTFLLMQYLRLLHTLGVSPAKLRDRYYSK